ncbi:MAG: hypothetical protein OXN81_19485 [Alphaproteobacteria bacterium]|nr:hypothetical protein [Alphaproteobacteria bacterium]
MDQDDRTAPDSGAPNAGGRDAALTAAILRIGASLDLDTVLREVIESARALTGAACGAIATVDEAGAPRDFVTPGFDEEQHRAMETWPDGPRLLTRGHRPGSRESGTSCRSR